MRRLATTFRIRLLLPVLVAVIPTAILLLFAVREERRLLLRQAFDDARRVAQLVASHEQAVLDSAGGLMEGLTRLPSMRRRDGAACSADVAPALAGARGLANVGAVTPDGEVFCSAVPFPGRASLADRAHVAGALRTGALAVGGHVVARSGVGDAIGIALPVRGDDGAVVAVAFGLLGEAALSGAIGGLALPPEVEVAVVDRHGVVITALGGELRAGAVFPAAPLAAAGWGAAALELPGPDGAPRLYAVDQVKLADGSVALRAVVSWPAAAAYAPANRLLATSLLAFGVIAALAVLAAAFLGEALLVRRLERLGVAARRIAAGDLSARSALPPAQDELGAFARSFDDMAAALEALSRQNRLLLESVGEGILGMDRAGRITFVNPAATRMLSRSAGEMLGEETHALLHPRRPDGAPFPADQCVLQAVLRDPAARHSGEDVFFRPDGTALPVEVTSSPVLDRGEAVGAVLAFRDVTERRRLEEQLRQSQKMEAVGQLAGGVAHDFNNVLTAILSFARLVEDALPPDHESQPDVAEIVRSAERAATLTRQLLAFSRRQRLAPRVHDLAETLRGMEPMLRRLLGAAVRLEVDVRSPGTVRADPGQLELVVLNLAVNARDAMPAGGRLRLAVYELAAGDQPPGGAELPGGALSVLEVADSGVGMDEPTLARAFEPFFTTKPAGKGTGLGLSTVYGIVSQSGGVVRVRSAPGAGTTFRVILPRAEREPERAVPPRGARPAGGTETILLVEDEEVLRGLARRTLHAAGYRVLEAGGAEEAAALVERSPRFDLLLTDVLLPGANGWELSQRLGEARPGLRVLFVSGYAADGAGRSALPPGVPFLAKPFTPDALLAKVREVLDGAAGRMRA